MGARWGAVGVGVGHARHRLPEVVSGAHAARHTGDADVVVGSARGHHLSGNRKEMFVNNLV